MLRLLRATAALGLFVLPLVATAGDSLGPYVGLRVRDVIHNGERPDLVAAPWTGERRGSGVIVGTSTSGGWLVLTNNHVVERMIDDGIPVPSVWADGAWRKGKILGTDPEADLALVMIRCPTKLRIARISPKPPRDGVKVTTRAFAAGTKWTTRETSLHHSMKLDDGKRALAPHTHFVKTTFKQGESGGAVCSGGLLVGLIYGNDIDNGWGLCVDHASITKFVSRWGWSPDLYAKLEPRPVGR